MFFFLTIVFLLVAWHAGTRMYAGVQVGHDMASAKQEVATLQQKNSELLKLLEYVKSPAFAEREARLRFGLGKADEKEVVIGTPDGPGVQPSVPAPAQPESNPHAWWRFFVAE